VLALRAIRVEGAAVTRPSYSVRHDGTGITLDLDWSQVEGLVIALERYRLLVGRSAGASPAVLERRRRVHALERALGEALATAEGVFQ
jgi:hypothetical protein